MPPVLKGCSCAKAHEGDDLAQRGTAAIAIHAVKEFIERAFQLIEAKDSKGLEILLTGEVAHSVGVLQRGHTCF